MIFQGSARHPGNTQKHIGQNPLKNPAKTCTKRNSFQFVMPVIMKDFFMFTASNSQ